MDYSMVKNILIVRENNSLKTKDQNQRSFTYLVVLLEVLDVLL